MKINKTQWVEIIRAISTAIIAIITSLCAQSCTMSLSVSKNNQNSTKRPNKHQRQALIVQKLILILKNIKKMEREFINMKDIFKILPTTQEEKEYMIVIGKHLATTEKFPTREAAEERINATDWNLVGAMIYACKEADEYEKKLKRTAKKIKNTNNSKKED